MSAVSYLRSVDRSYSMERLFGLIGKTRQNYHRSLAVSKRMEEQEMEIIQRVKRCRIDHPEMGSRSLFYFIRHLGISLPIGITAFERLLSRKGLTVKRVKKFVPQTSDGKGNRDFPNLTNGLDLNGINQLIVADITYIWVDTRWYYLFILKDVYSQRLISVVPSQNMKASNAIKTLKELVRLRGSPEFKGCIHHSDNGSQYDSTDFLKYLDELKIQVSRAKSCSQNGSCEQMHHIIKNMYLRHWGLRSFEDLVRACKKVKRLMNEQRTIEQLGNRTVEEFEEYIKMLSLEHRPTKILYDFSTKE